MMTIGKLCSYDGCFNSAVNDIYSFCMNHMSNQTPIHEIEKPSECPICFEPDIDQNDPYLQLTCGHWIHKNCIIRAGRVGCPLCRQFIFLEKKVFLNVRIVNLERKLDILSTVYRVDRLRLELRMTRIFLHSNLIQESDLDIVDKYLQLLNKFIFEMF